jgi:hypothetical protein
MGNQMVWFVIVLLLIGVIFFMYQRQQNIIQRVKNTRKQRKQQKKFGPWGKWGDCSVECGGGIKQRTRDCLGNDCVGPYTQTKACNTDPCVQKTYYVPTYYPQSLLTYPRRWWGGRRRRHRIRRP